VVPFSCLGPYARRRRNGRWSLSSKFFSNWTSSFLSVMPVFMWRSNQAAGLPLALLFFLFDRAGTIPPVFKSSRFHVSVRLSSFFSSLPWFSPRVCSPRPAFCRVCCWPPFRTPRIIFFASSLAQPGVCGCRLFHFLVISCQCRGKRTTPGFVPSPSPCCLPLPQDCSVFSLSPIIPLFSHIHGPDHRFSLPVKGRCICRTPLTCKKRVFRLFPFLVVCSLVPFFVRFNPLSPGSCKLGFSTNPFYLFQAVVGQLPSPSNRPLLPSGCPWFPQPLLLSLHTHP